MFIRHKKNKNKSGLSEDNFEKQTFKIMICLGNDEKIQSNTKTVAAIACMVRKITVVRQKKRKLKIISKLKSGLIARGG